MTSDAVSAERRLRPSTPPFQPAADVLSGETADVYFERTRRILATEGLDPVVTMEIFCRADAILCGAMPRFVRLRAPDWSFDPAELSSAFNARTRAIIINTPNNPTGKVFTREELESIAALCRQWEVTAITGMACSAPSALRRRVAS